MRDRIEPDDPEWNDPEPSPSDIGMAGFLGVLRQLRRSGGSASIAALSAAVGGGSAAEIVAEMAREGLLVIDGDTVRLRQDLGQGAPGRSRRDSEHLKD